MPHVKQCFLLLVLAVATVAAEPGANMIGRQSQNEGLSVLPAPAKVVIDGDLAEWDWSGRVWVFADAAVRNRFSVEAAAMWDREFLYLAAKWRDPTPMYSLVDPEFNVNDGWKADSWQLRIRTDEISHLTTWYFTPKKMPVLHAQYGKSLTQPFGGEGTFHVAAENGTVLGRGIEMAYRADADGQGFVQELKLPWGIIYKTPPVAGPDQKFQVGMEFLWGDPSGKTFPIHRYADNLQAGVTSREFFWTNWKAWGEARLLAQGHVPVREYVTAEDRIAGTIPIRVQVPKTAARFTLVVENAAGQRLRNLAGDCDPLDYAVAEAGDQRTVEVKWDGLDDDGKLAPPGDYRVRGLTQNGLGAEYELTFYNPGTPPWSTSKGNGAWGADHAAPQCVARAGEWMIVAWGFAEGGCGIIGVAPDGLKKWGEKRGTGRLAADKQYVYAVPSDWHTKQETLCRLGAHDGSYQPFVLDGKPRPFELPVADIFGDQPHGQIVALAAHGGKLALALNDDRIAILNAASAKLETTFLATHPSALAYAPDGTLCALLNGQPHRIVNQQATPVAATGIGHAVSLATDGDGNLVVLDGGPDLQVKAFRPDGQLAYTCGLRGGRPLRGVFEPQGLRNVSSVAVDAKGQVWTVENGNYPRRVAVWGRDGKLVRQYVGNTGYAGTGCYLHDQDPTLGYCGPLEFKLDAARGTWELVRILWVPDPAQGECFEVPTGAHVQPQRFRATVAGQAHEYLYTHDPRDGSGHVIFQETARGWQPVTAVCLVGHVSGGFSHNGELVKEPAGEMAGLNGFDGCFWNDENGDGKVQRAECAIVPAKQPAAAGKRGAPPFGLDNGWGGRIGQDFVFYLEGLTQCKPLRFTPTGAPVYGPESLRPVGVKDWGDLVPVPEENLLLCLSWQGYAGPTRLIGVGTQNGAIRWRYPNPYPSVHGSHRATMPKPGLLIGPLKTLGVAAVSPEIGRVFLMRGNLGQDFYMTTDGLFVGAMFNDGRLPGEALPDQEAQLRGRPMESYSHGGEPFNGWFGRQDDGKFRITAGLAREACMVMTIRGLESIRRLPPQPLTLTPQEVAKADADNAARALAAAAPPTWAVPRLAQPPALDGDFKDWGKTPAVTISRPGAPDKAVVRLAWDATNLYLAAEVTDPSPWRNEGKDYTRLFKTGDAVDLQLATDPGAPAKRRDPAAGDLRVVFAPLAGQPAAVLMVPIAKDAPKTVSQQYVSPVGTKTFDRVEVLRDLLVSVKVEANRYRLEAAVPWAVLGVTPKAGLVLRGDVGFISSDAAGLVNAARTYWANPATNLTSDLPLEAWLYPSAWGELTLTE